MSSGVVLLATDRKSTNVLYHALANEFGQVSVVLEAPTPRWTMIVRRIKRLGFSRVMGQLLFMTAVRPFLRRAAAPRMDEIRKEFGMDTSPIPGKVIRVSSVNAPEAIDALRHLDPDLIIVAGTRILSAQTLRAIQAPLINIHSGITPAFRGSHGGYWALAEGHPEFAGTTIHFVDEGIDTGGVLKQARIDVTSRDNFMTYPELQLGVGVPILLQAVRELLAGQPIKETLSCPLPSRLCSHPTLWSYFKTRLTLGIK